MKGFGSALFDKLFDDGPAIAEMRRFSVDELKGALARDLESLLNTRMVMDGVLLDDYPEARCSIINYGLTDFSSMSLSNVHDRKLICAAIRQAIAANEPRLHNVEVWLDPDRRSTNQLMFSIKAWLVLDRAGEPVGFDAMLQSTTLQYSVASSGRVGTAT